MIRYALICDAGHAFESWFRDSESFDRQVRRGQVNCPTCQSARISKQIMAPAVATRKEEAGQPMVMPAAPDAEIRQMLRALREQIEANAEHVGPRFAEEARKIHYGETEERAIYGTTSIKEAAALHEEGIEVMPIPVLPDDRN
ncbi:MAG: DUF1178 family protein [Beijerinckiaceae bacterium]|nr:DUF1178 family protein [Beijerinckiaceae bacterium]MCZ8300739.1 DUF1178 family protein [Beijerinckiaceae bacterium]